MLRVGWPDDPDNLNPFIGWETSSYEVWLLNYDFLVGYDPGPARRGPSLAETLGHLARRQDLDLPAAPGRELAGRCSRSPPGRRLHLQLHHRERDVRVRQPDHRHRPRWWPSTTTPCRSSAAGPRRTCCASGSRSCPSTSGQGRAQGGRSLLPNRPPIVGTGPFQVVEFKKGHYVKMVGQPRLLGQGAGGRRDHLRHLPEPGHDDAGPQVRGRSTPPGGSRRRSSPARRPGHHGPRPTTTATGTTSTSTATRARARWAIRCCVTPPSAGPELRRRPRAARRHRLERATPSRAPRS